MVTILDDFESGSLSTVYGGDTGSFSVESSSPVYEGSYSLHSTSNAVAITRTDVSISPGETPFGAWQYGDLWVGTYGTNGRLEGFVWGVPSETGYASLSGYAVLGTNNDSETIDYRLYRFDSGSKTDLGSVAIVNPNTWNKVNVTQWDSNGNITVEIVDSSGTVVNSLSTIDSNYGGGGVGWVVDGDGGTTVGFDYAFKPTNLSPPSNVHFNDTTTEDQLTLDWDTSGTNASGYYVYRSQSSGSTKSDYTRVADVTGPPYTDTSLEDGERYYYRVSSHD